MLRAGSGAEMVLGQRKHNPNKVWARANDNKFDYHQLIVLFINLLAFLQYLSFFQYTNFIPEGVIMVN